MFESEGGPASRVVPVTEVSQVGEARRAASWLGAQAELDENENGTLAVVVTEIATNLARYATNGLIAMRVVGAPGCAGVELLAVDSGPGITDLGRAMSDGFSSGGTAGHGLGAVRRMASEFDLSSSPTGTVLLARVWSAEGTRFRRERPLAEGVVCTPIAGERACGDAWLVHQDGDRTVLFVVDGLGHGVEAARAADTAIRVVREHLDTSPSQLLQIAHGALRSTRGAAMAVAHLRRADGEIRFAGVGNISGTIASIDGMKSMASHNGTVGHSITRVHEFTYAFPPDACVIMHSDGLMTRWRLDSYPGLQQRHPALVAGVLHRDFTRGRDDATVLVVRHRPLQAVS